MVDLRKASYDKMYGDKSSKQTILSEANTNEVLSTKNPNNREYIFEMQDQEFRQNLISIHSLVESMLIYDPRKRISAKKALKNPYFDGGVPRPKPTPDFLRALGHYPEDNLNE